MNREEIDRLLNEESFPDQDGHTDLVETHISWVLLGSRFVYKIKKPVQYSFLDFSTLERRKYFCEREVELNKRLTKDIYLDVLPVRLQSGRFSIGAESGEIMDYAVRMKKMNREKQMDFLVLHDQVSRDDIKNLAAKIAKFHKETEIITQKDLLDIQKKFMDLEGEKEFLNTVHLEDGSGIIDHSVKISGHFIKKNMTLLERRLQAGFIRDCHGDLHTRNIFLLPDPQPFDCIEFNEDYRQIDVLNEVAFLCMDLDALGRSDLSDLFIQNYNQLFPTIKTPEDHQLFVYFKSYRANIRAKVNSLRARSSEDKSDREKYLAETGKYLHLMDWYIRMLPAL